MKLGKSQRDKDVRKVASVACFNADGLLLFGLRSDNDKWTLPGGHLEEGEAPLEAAKRELKEEAGIDGKNFQLLGRGVVGDVLVYAYRCDGEGDPDPSKDPDEECATWRWVEASSDSDLPREISENLHSPRNVTLRLLGLQSGEVEEPMQKDAPREFRSTDGIRIPATNDPGRKGWDKKYFQGIAEAYVGGDVSRLRRVKVPLTTHLGSNMAVNKPRLRLYSRMARAGEKLPPVVVRRNGIGFSLIDGNHRAEAAKANGLTELEGYEILDKPSNQGLAKGLRGPVVAAMLAGSSPAMGQPPADKPVAPQAYQWTNEGLSHDLHPIAQLESSGGLNVNHAPHSGGEYHTAYGALGFKPVTAHEEYKRSQVLQSKFPGLSNPSDFVRVFKVNPKFYNLLASAHWARLAGHHKGDLSRTAYAWRWGATAATHATHTQVENDTYVQKYKHLALHQLQPQQPIAMAKSDVDDPIDALLDHDDPRERILALKHAAVTPYHLRRGLEDEDPSVREFAAKHPKMTQPLLEEALRHKDEAVRRAALSRPDLQDKHLELVLFDPDLQTEVARHPALTQEQRHRMADHLAIPSGLKQELLGKTEILTYPNIAQVHKITVSTNPDTLRALQLRSPKHKLAAGTLSGPHGITAAVNVDDPYAEGNIHHEAQHVVFATIKQKHGHHVAQATVDQTLATLDSDSKKYLNHLTKWAIKGKYEADKIPEEQIAYLHNYLQDPVWRQRAHKAMGIHGNRDAEKLSQSYAHRIWSQLQARASSLTAREVGAIHKSEDETIGEWMAINKVQDDTDYNVYEDMLGLDGRAWAMIRAAEFLAHRKADLGVFREVLVRTDDLDIAALQAVAMDPTEENKKSLKAVLSIQDFGKGEELLPSHHEVQALMPDGEAVADGIRRGLNAHTEKALMLGGKHSAGAMAIRDPRTQQQYLIKPGSGKQSPAAGARQDPANQSRREAAFWHVAQMWGIGIRFPRADLILLDRREVAALHLLPPDWVNFEKIRTKNPGMISSTVPGHILDRFRLSGELHRWAVIDFVLGNPDRHGQNIMVGPQRDEYPIALIDHGSAFAGDQFDPANDKNSFTPYYLRAWQPDAWSTLDMKHKLSAIPTLSRDRDEELRHWIERLHADDLETVLHRFGIDPEPSVKRLTKIKSLLAAENVSAAINKLWVTT